MPSHVRGSNSRPVAHRKNYLCVFHVNSEVLSDVVDLGQDPDFSPPPATWGICRPQVRSKWLNVGSEVFFIGFDRKADSYLGKGWFKVGEIITYVEALRRFPTRRNVIIRFEEEVGTRARDEVKWKRKDLRRLCEARFGTPQPEFLSKTGCQEKFLVQNPDDDHEIDNWKCQRMFLCREQQLVKCINEARCMRESEFPGLSGYIVAEKWCDVGPKRIPWQELAPPSMMATSLRTPMGQHNVLPIGTDEMARIRESVFKLNGAKE